VVPHTTPFTHVPHGDVLVASEKKTMTISMRNNINNITQKILWVMKNNAKDSTRRYPSQGTEGLTQIDKARVLVPV
jgi:hypothetical protein